MAAGVVAKPPGFLLKMRVVQPDGTPFFSRPFRVQWGDALIPPQEKAPLQTDRNGAFSVLLPQPRPLPPQGDLRFVERVEETEVVVWTIPLQIADPAPLFPFPALLEDYVPPPGHAGAGDEPEDAERRRRYVEDAIRQIRENLGELYRFWSDVREILRTLPPAPLETDPDPIYEQILDEAVLAYTAVVNGYQSAYRLWNMADLSLWQEPALDFTATDHDLLLRAIQRFAYRHGLEPLSTPPTPTSFKPILEKIQDVHDARGALRPAKS